MPEQLMLCPHADCRAENWIPWPDDLVDGQSHVHECGTCERFIPFTVRMEVDLVPGTERDPRPQPSEVPE